MKIVKSIIKIATCFLLATTLPAHASIDPKQTDAVQQIITNMMTKNRIPGVAVVLYLDGNPYLYNFGSMAPNTKEPVTPDTIFEIGSVTKIFTNLLIAEQVNAGKMQLNTPIKTYLPALSPGFNQVTLENLGTHTSGLPFGGPETFASRQSINRFLSIWQPSDVPGTQWSYSNLGIELLGDSVERMEKKNYNQLCIDGILRPLNMEPVAISIPQEFAENVAKGTSDANKPAKRFDTQNHLFSAAGGMKISPRNMQKFLAAALYLDNTPPEIQNAMRLTQMAYVKLPDEYHGLGWQIHPINTATVNMLLRAPEKMDFGPIPVSQQVAQPFYDGNALMDKTGSTAGFRAYIAVIPNRKTGIAILANKNISNAAIVDAGRQILFYMNNILANPPV